MDEHACSATIHLDAIRHNFGEARRCAEGRQLVAVVKADAYGHGAVPVARALVSAGCSRLAVVHVTEAVCLRDAGVAAPILVLGGVAGAADARAAVELGLAPVVHHAEHVALLAEAARAGRAPLGVQVELDTGMKRMGVAPEAAAGVLAAVEAEPSLRLEGVFTHFARADEPDLAPTLAQLVAFRRILDAAAAAGVRPGLVHAANSAGLLAGKPLWEALPALNAARPGLMLYGVRPAEHLEADLRPAMTLRARVAQLHRVKAGEAVGYSAGFRATRDTTIATLPLGYEDGVPVSSSGRGSVLIRGRRLPIAGRVSMDYTGVEVADAPVCIGDEAVFFGQPQNGLRLSVEDVAEAAGTIAYELLVRVGARVPRVFVD